MTRCWLLVGFLLLAAADARAWDPTQAARRAAAEGQRALAEGDTTAAIRNLMRAQALSPEDPEIRMGLGETLYEATEYESARRQFEAIGADPLAGGGAQALYNAGNSAFGTGDLEMALDLFTRALLDAGDDAPEDLLFNLELTQRLIEEQQQQEQDQSGENSEDQNQEQSDQQNQQDQSQQEQQEQQDQQQQQQEQQDQQDEQQQQREQPQPEQPQAEDQSEAEQSPEGEQPEEMTPEEAMRLLQALDADEEELRKSIQRRLRGDEEESEHDW